MLYQVRIGGRAREYLCKYLYPLFVSPCARLPSLQALGERVEKVTVSSRLLDSPCALVTSKFGWSANMERIMRSQALGDARAMEYMRGRKIMEINPKHDIISGIKTLLKVSLSQDFL